MMAHTTATIPALDLRPTGKLPAAVSEAAEQEAVRRSVDAQFPVIAAFLADATPKVIEPNPGAPIFSAALSEDLGAVVLCLNEDVNLETPEATRDAARQAAAFVTSLNTLAGQQAGTTAPLAGAPVRPVRITGPGKSAALIVADLYTSDDPDNPRTVAAIRSESCSDVDTDSAGARQTAANLREGADALDALADQLAAIEQSAETGPASGRSEHVATRADAQPRTFTIPIRGGGILTETCLRDCTIDHQPQTDGEQHAEDIWHHIGDEPSVTLPVFDPEQGTVEDNFLTAQIMVAPHSKDPRLQVPHVGVDIAQNYSVMEGLTPDEFAAVIDQLAAHVDQMRAVHARLVQARAEWDAR
ncbi:DUF6907 domain-containing protein [Streptomyces sp. NEAU-Y11]|uniref:DUF6907 domain-containing protein n=1 Tax=Streptomyces cucumeris TaxID=2962890 RepID=UPI0020C85254|nr:hypothetical protein [Streptomyces sp. NEAU-Y11]MCP9209956.1 hypothetical protein [Streptomyces sp. NEAU-Y11]